MTADETPNEEEPAVGAVGLRREMHRRYLSERDVWAGYLSLGGAMTFLQMDAALCGLTVVSPAEYYLLAQALNA